MGALSCSVLKTSGLIREELGYGPKGLVPAGCVPGFGRVGAREGRECSRAARGFFPGSICHQGGLLSFKQCDGGSKGWVSVGSRKSAKVAETALAAISTHSHCTGEAGQPLRLDLGLSSDRRRSWSIAEGSAEWGEVSTDIGRISNVGEPLEVPRPKGWQRDCDSRRRTKGERRKANGVVCIDLR